MFRSAEVVKGSNVRERCERINQSWKGESAGVELRFTVLLERYITIKRERKRERERKKKGHGNRRIRKVENVTSLVISSDEMSEVLTFAVL